MTNVVELKRTIKEAKECLNELVHAEAWMVKEWTEATLKLTMIIGKERWPKVAKYCKLFVSITEQVAKVPEEVAFRALEELRGGE